jgi:hypothetical protein
MDGLTYEIELRDGKTVAVGNWVPAEGVALSFRIPFEEEAEIEPMLLLLQTIHARRVEG